MALHKNWFCVDKEKRAARVRSYPLPFILREAIANSLDANATKIEVLFSIKQGTRSNHDAQRAFTLTCTDNGRGCDDPEILRTVGSSTSDLHPEKRGRFGQGLIDVLAICDKATIRTKRHRLLFNDEGCKTGLVRNPTLGMVLDAELRHDGEGLDDLERYFASMMLPVGVSLAFNGMVVQQRKVVREILQIQLPTVVFDPSLQRMKTHPRRTNIHIHEKHSEEPMIHELGIPVDAAPWELPFDIDILQKTPLDMERCMLPAPYKERLIVELVNPLSDLYEDFMKKEERVPAEILSDGTKARNLSGTAKETAAETIYERPLSLIGRRNPFDPQDRSRSQELETIGVLPVNTAHAPAGMREILSACPTIEVLHTEHCKAHFSSGVIPALTERQERCVTIYREIASALLNREVLFHHFQASAQGDAFGLRAVYRRADGSIGLNTQVKHLWQDPLGVESLGVVVHECAHEAVEGHGIDFQREIQRLAGKLAVWVGSNPDRWNALEQIVKG